MINQCYLQHSHFVNFPPFFFNENRACAVISVSRAMMTSESRQEINFCNGCEIDLKTIHQWTEDRDKMLDFCYRHRLLRKSVRCPNCNSEIFLNDKNYYRCDRVQIENRGYKKRKGERCRFQRSGMKHTFFDRSHLKMSQVLQLVYWFLISTVTHDEICDQLNIASQTLTNWFRFCREVIYWQEERNSRIECFDGYLAFSLFKKQFPRTKEAFHQFCIAAANLYSPPQ